MNQSENTVGRALKKRNLTQNYRDLSFPGEDLNKDYVKMNTETP